MCKVADQLCPHLWKSSVLHVAYTHTHRASNTGIGDLPAPTEVKMLQHLHNAKVGNATIGYHVAQTKVKASQLRQRTNVSDTSVSDNTSRPERDIERKNESVLHLRN
jgi:hypothetical protein